MSGTVDYMKLAELTADELGADELDVVSAGSVSMIFSRMHVEYKPQKDDSSLAASR